MQVRPLSETDKAWVKERTELLFSGTFLVSREIVHDPTELPGFIAAEGDERIGLATYHIDGDQCELVSIDALCQYMGVGTSLLEAVENIARESGCTHVWTITTNDNLDAQRFFQRRGFAIDAYRVGGMEKIRAIKPGIPLTGSYGIPIRDEIELNKSVVQARGWRTV